MCIRLFEAPSGLKRHFGERDSVMVMDHSSLGLAYDPLLDNDPIKRLQSCKKVEAGA